MKLSCVLSKVTVESASRYDQKAAAAARNEALGCRGEQWRFISLLVGDLMGFSKTMGIFSFEGTGSLRGCREHPEASV